MSPAPRTDLLALTEEALVALSNRGFFKRAAKELAAGAGAAIDTASDGVVTARYPDGVEVSLAAGQPLEKATCNCAAPGMCRHRIGLVLAYQAAVLHAGPLTPDAATPTPAQPSATISPEPSETPDANLPGTRAPSATWSPGTIPDEALIRCLGARSVESARRRLAQGLLAVVHRPARTGTNTGPGAGSTTAPRAELPTCTVTFHVPDDPAYATTDAVQHKRGEAVALAVWAFRAADDQGLHSPTASVSIPAATATAPTTAASAGSTSATSSVSVLTSAADLVDNVLGEGVAHVGPVLISNLRRAAADLTGESLHWPAAVVTEIADQLGWYAGRDARYEMARVADLVTEFHARRRAATTPTTMPRARLTAAQILGTGESSRTPLRRIRLVALGCRIVGGPAHREARLYFAQPADGTVLMLRREWNFEDGDTIPTGNALGGRRITGSPLRMLAVSNLVSEAATRSASRIVDIGASRLARTSITPIAADSWRNILPEPLIVHDFAAHAEHLRSRPPRFIRPRIEAENVHVLTAAQVSDVRYNPAEQTLEAVISDVHGNEALVRSAYRSACPGALAALSNGLEAAAETASPDRPILLSGTVALHPGARAGGNRTSATSGRLIIDPIAIGAADQQPMIVPDLAPGDDTAALPSGQPAFHVLHRHTATAATLGTDALHSATSLLAEHAHRGLLRTPAGSARKDLAPIAAALTRCGHTALAALLNAYLATLDAIDGLDSQAATQPAPDAWADAHLLATASLEATA